jgi:hypothetical protein
MVSAHDHSLPNASRLILSLVLQVWQMASSIYADDEESAAADASAAGPGAAGAAAGGARGGKGAKSGGAAAVPSDKDLE